VAEITDPGLLGQLNAVAPPISSGGAAAPSGLVTDPELLKQLNAGHPEKPSAIGGFFSSIPGGIVSGFSGAASALGQAEAPMSGVDPTEVPGGEATAKAIEKNVTGDLPTPNRYGKAVGEAIGNPASYIGPGGLLAKVLTAAGGAVGGEAAGDVAEKLAPDAPKTQAAMRLIGAIAGGHSVGAPAKIVTPNIIAPERQAMLDVLNREGVTATTAGQRIGSKPLKYTESVMADQPFAGRNAEQINENVADQFTQAALRRVGENATRATPEVVDRSFNRIGNTFDRLTARNTMALDQPVQNDLLNTTIEYHNNVNPLMRAPVVENTMNDIASWAGQQGGQLTGAQYQNLRSRLSAAARGSNDPQLSHALSDMSESLDNAMERSIAATNPADAGAFAEARRQYRNMLVIERAATSGGAEKVGQGIITPAALSTAAKTVLGRRSFARGQDDFSELAHAGTGILTPLPQSGTGPRENIIHHLQLAGLLGAEPAAAAAGAHAPGMIAAGLGGIAAPAIAGRVIMSRPVQSYLSNQVAPYRLGTSPTMEALVNQIRGSQAPQIPSRGQQQ
jgi:hypothetical protein